MARHARARHSAHRTRHRPDLTRKGVAPGLDLEKRCASGGGASSFAAWPCATPFTLTLAVLANRCSGEASPADDGGGQGHEGFVDVVADLPTDARTGVPFMGSPCCSSVVKFHMRTVLSMLPVTAMAVSPNHPIASAET